MYNDIMHTCSKCGFCKPDGAFYPYGANGKPKSPCKECRRTYRPPPESVTEKRCSVCGEIKGVGDFGPTDRTKSGRRSACWICERAWRPKQIVTPEEKRCCTCQEVKPSTGFYKDSRRTDGLYARCKPCHNAVTGPASTEYQRKHPDKTQRWRKAAQSKFYSVPGRMDAQIKRLRAWNIAHPESKAVREQKRRARKAGAVNDFTRKQWEALKVAYGHRCVYCGEHTKRLTMDHVIPISKGGEHTARNIVPACGPCNTRKNDGPAPDHQISFPIEAFT